MSSSAQYQGVVTPEAVVLEFDIAGLGSRAVGAMIDFTLMSIGLIIFGLAGALLSSVFTDGPAWLGMTILILGVFGLTFGYPILFETFWNGRTPGKAALGLRVVTAEGSPIRFRHAAIRGVLGIFEVFFLSGAIAAIMIATTKKHQRLGDLIAGTVVLRERSAMKAPNAVVFTPPPWAEEYTSTLDTSLLSGDLYLALRSMVLRANTLNPQARVSLSEQLGRQVAAQLRATPPEWMTAELFLLCVATAYQRRYQPVSWASNIGAAQQAPM